MIYMIEPLDGKWSSLLMEKIPPKTEEEFTKFIKEEFNGNSGMAIKCVWDFFKGQNRDTRMDSVENRLEAVEVIVSELISDESNKKEEKKESFLDGSPCNQEE